MFFGWHWECCVIYSSFCCFLMEILSLNSLFLWIQQSFSKLVWYNTLKWLSLTNTEFFSVYFCCLPVFFPTFLRLLSLAFSMHPLFRFPSFYKSVPVWSHTSPAPDCRQENQMLSELWALQGKTKGWLSIKMHFLLSEDKAVSGCWCLPREMDLLPELLTDFWLISSTLWKCFSRV